MDSVTGADFAQLLVRAFEAMAEEAKEHLLEAGHGGLTVANELAMQAIADGADSAANLARALGVTRQAAAKTIGVLTGLGYVERAPDPADARRKHLAITDRGVDAVAVGAEGFAAAYARWHAAVGSDIATSTVRALQRLADGRQD